MKKITMSLLATLSATQALASPPMPTSIFKLDSEITLDTANTLIECKQTDNGFGTHYSLNRQTPSFPFGSFLGTIQKSASTIRIFKTEQVTKDNLPVFSAQIAFLTSKALYTPERKDRPAADSPEWKPEWKNVYEVMEVTGLDCRKSADPKLFTLTCRAQEQDSVKISVYADSGAKITKSYTNVLKLGTPVLALDDVTVASTGGSQLKFGLLNSSFEVVSRDVFEDLKPVEKELKTWEVHDYFSDPEFLSFRRATPFAPRENPETRGTISVFRNAAFQCRYVKPDASHPGAKASSASDENTEE